MAIAGGSRTSGKMKDIHYMDIRGLYKEGTKLLEEYQNHPP